METPWHAQWNVCSLNQDDLIRREVIKRLICDFRLNFAAVEQAHGLVFREYFAEDLKLLQTFIDDGLVRMTEEGLEVISTGQLLIRNICMCFDVYLRNKARQQQFSPVI